ncbi:hypothetical protein [Azospirillum oryzae]|uniref:hypothetical protein n=1 Tax=Azospirillum oryzae TaxID=286727 RepID=UPI00267FA26A
MLDAASLPVDRRARRAKTDRIDVDGLVRALAALALQLRFCTVGLAGERLMASPPRRPCDDGCGLDRPPGQAVGNYGTGPRYRKIGGRVVYALDDLKAWADQGLRTSTSDPGAGTVRPARRS